MASLKVLLLHLYGPGTATAPVSNPSFVTVLMFSVCLKRGADSTVWSFWLVTIHTDLTHEYIFSVWPEPESEHEPRLHCWLPPGMRSSDLLIEEVQC